MIVTESIGSSKKQTGKRVLKRTRGLTQGKQCHSYGHVRYCINDNVLSILKVLMYKIPLAGVKRNQKKKGPKDAVAPTKGGSEKYKSPANVHKHKQLDLSTTLVKMWEQFREHTCSNRAEILQNILTIIKGCIKEVRQLVAMTT